MIVFTARNKVTNEVFVGSTRNSVEEHWAQLIIKADENAAGEILEQIRSQGADSFELETWAYSETAGETRELVNDACEELNATIIKTGRAAAITTVKKAESDTPLRQAGSTQDYQDIKDLMVKIEMKRKENRRTATATQTKPAAKKINAPTEKAVAIPSRSNTNQTKHSKTVTSKNVPSKDRLPEGRVGSSSKEKRIREAIAKEKMEREAKKAAQVAAEADEMAAIMAKLDAKTKEKAKLLRKR